MFTVELLRETSAKNEFQEDFALVRQELVSSRLNQSSLFSGVAGQRLNYFAECVLASVPTWPEDHSVDVLDLCRLAGEVSEALSGISSDKSFSERHRFRAALLYELGDYPALASSISSQGSLFEKLENFFCRRDEFGSLGFADSQELPEDISAQSLSLGELALLDDATAYGKFLQDSHNSATEESTVSKVASRIACQLALEMSATELAAFSRVLARRGKRATLTNITPSLHQQLKQTGFPTELLPAQYQAVAGGLLEKGLRSWGFAAPTGSGKTYISRLAVLDQLLSSPDSKIIYVVPSKALVHEVSVSLRQSLGPVGIKTLAVSSQLVDLDDEELDAYAGADVLVLTPEKADLLLRLKYEFLDQVGIVIIDEAHHIEGGTRGTLLEFYLWRLRKLLTSSVRFMFLSAVAPNISRIAHWLGGPANSVIVSQRPTRMRAGVYRLKKKGSKYTARIDYADGTAISIDRPKIDRRIRGGICQLATFLRTAGPVLVVAKGKKECEHLAEELWKQLGDSPNELATEEELSRLDSFLEREMYTDVPMRRLLRHGIAYHHAGLPPRIRNAVEDAIRKGFVSYVFATTTLAEGVNFPFSSVIVQSLALKEAPEKGKPSRYNPVTPRSFWNIAGRAGRPGFDREGQVILFEPSLGLDKVNAVLGPYLNPSMENIGDVKSSLAEAIIELQELSDSGEFDLEDIGNAELPAALSRRARGTINLVRIGIVHAQAAKLIDSPEEIIDTSFAASFLDQQQLAFAMQLFAMQGRVVLEYSKKEGAPSIETIAQLGLSIETLEELRKYVEQMETWQMQNLGQLFRGGSVNLKQAPYIIGPVAKRMAELEGPRLGGFYSTVIVNWLAGLPFVQIKSESKFDQRLEDLIAVVYSRVQFLLPWGLYATDALIETEAKKRNLNYENDVLKLAYLSDCGVPNFDALRLVNSDIERVDATRLSIAYKHSRKIHEGLDLFGWLFSLKQEALEEIVTGEDKRKVAHGFYADIDKLRGSSRQ